MKVLFAVNDDNISTSVITKYQQKFKEIITSKNVYYFKAIIKELQSFGINPITLKEEKNEFM